MNSWPPRQSYGNFILSLRFHLIDGNGNSGVQFRSACGVPGTEMSGYQADLGESYWGCLYDESRCNKTLVKASDEAIVSLSRKVIGTSMCCAPWAIGSLFISMESPRSCIARRPRTSPPMDSSPCRSTRANRWRFSSRISRSVRCPERIQGTQTFLSPGNTNELEFSCHDRDLGFGPKCLVGRTLHGDAVCVELRDSTVGSSPRHHAASLLDPRTSNRRPCPSWIMFLPTSATRRGCFRPMRCAKHVRSSKNWSDDRRARAHRDCRFAQRRNY